MQTEVVGSFVRLVTRIGVVGGIGHHCSQKGNVPRGVFSISDFELQSSHQTTFTRLLTDL